MILDDLYIKHTYESEDGARDPITNHWIIQIRCIDCNHSEYSEYKPTRDEALLDAGAKMKTWCAATILLKAGMVDYLRKRLGS